MKFNRNYALFIQKNAQQVSGVELADGNDIKITPPFTLEFEVSRNSFSSANIASFRIYNLAPNTRTGIRKDVTDFGNIRNISFSAGYGDKLALGFSGNISQAWSVREGTNYITQIESYDGGYAYVNAVTNDQFPAGTRRVTIMQALVKQLPGIKPGAIGNFDGAITRGNSLSGNTMDLLDDASGGKAFIDNGRLHILQDDECIEAPTYVINSKSGLLGTPMRNDTYISLEMLFEPQLQVGQLVKLESSTATHFSGIHRVLSVRHKGTISPVTGGQCTTSVTLLPGQFAPVRVGS